MAVEIDEESLRLATEAVIDCLDTEDGRLDEPMTETRCFRYDGWVYPIDIAKAVLEAIR